MSVVGVEWGETNDFVAEDFCTNQFSKESLAIEGLKEYLADGPKAQKDVHEYVCTTYEVSPTTVTRAKYKLGVKSQKTNSFDHGEWMWSLPEKKGTNHE
jgi:hypothetical protein